MKSLFLLKKNYKQGLKYSLCSYYKILLGIILVMLVILSFYLSIFWLEWILIFSVFILLCNKLIKSHFRKTKLYYRVLLFFIELVLIICLFFPLHLLMVWFSASATVELINDGLQNQLACNQELMYCTQDYEECDYKNTRNCICQNCFRQLSYEDCSGCFIHDHQALCQEANNTCYLAW